jgi:hypothetical protein
VAIATEFPSLMLFHPPAPQVAIRSDPLSVKIMAERQDETGRQAERHASHSFLSVTSEPTVLLNHERKTRGHTLR